MEAAQVHSERTGQLLNISSNRFRYTTGTRAAREGFGEMVIAELLDHSDTQNAGVSIENIPEYVENLDKAVGFQLARYAQAFAGVLVDTETNAKAEELDTTLILFGPSGEIEKQIPITIQEFNLMEKGAVHITEFGVCVHDFTMTPCEKYRDCLNCSEQVCIKGDQDKLVRIKFRLEEVTKKYNEALNAMNSGHAGADRWYEYHKNTMQRLQELISLLENPKIQEGAQIKLRNDKAFSPLRRAIESKITSPKLNNHHELTMLEDMTKLLGGGLG